MKKNDSVPNNNTAKERFDAVLGDIKNRSYKEIQENGYNIKVEKFLMIKELIKEQLPDENTHTATSKVR